MAELACTMVYVYVFGGWTWIHQGTAVRDGLPFRACAKLQGHEGSHTPGFERVREVKLEPMAVEDRERRRAAYRQREHARIVAAFDRFLRETYGQPDEDPHEIYHKVFQESAVCTVPATESASDSPVAHKSHYGATPDGGSENACRTCGCALDAHGVCEDCRQAHLEREPSHWGVNGDPAHTGGSGVQRNADSDVPEVPC